MSRGLRAAEHPLNLLGMALACTEDGLDVQVLEAMNTGRAFRIDGSIEEVAKLQLDLATFAFDCNATRVATLQVGDGTDNTRYTVNGQRVERFHWISHRQTSDGNDGHPIPNAVEWHIAIDRIRMETFKYLLDEWWGIPLGNGTLLDNAFALWSHKSRSVHHAGSITCPSSWLGRQAGS